MYFSESCIESFDRLIVIERASARLESQNRLCISIIDSERKEI